MGGGLVSRLRSRIKDERYKSAAFSISVSGTGIADALVEITGRRLITTITGGSTSSLNLDLSDTKYATVGRLAREIDRVGGYEVRIDDDAEHGHPSDDIEILPPTEITNDAVILNTRLFADQELLEELDDAAKRHNPGYMGTTVPAEEEVLVLQLAHASILRIQAADASKRKGLDETVESLITLSSAFEKAYKDDYKRLMRVIPSPVESATQRNLLGRGDVVIGSLYRKSPRNGYMTPLSASLGPDDAVLLDPEFGDVEDNNVKLRWLRNKEAQFYTYELWRDTQPHVERSRLLVLISDGNILPATFEENEFDRPTTSRLVFRSFGPNSTRESRAFTAFVEAFGQLVTNFIDRGELGDGLESEFDYYYRLYIVNVNGDSTASRVIKVRTKPIRARFADTDEVTPVEGPVGTSITINATNVATTTVATIAGKRLDNEVITPGGIGTVVGDIPSFDVVGKKDAVLTSETGLFDVRRNIFEVTS